MNNQETCKSNDYERFLMPAEGNPHTATWMTYGATAEVWARSCYRASRLIARKDILRIAVNLSRFEPVKIVINEEDWNEAQDFLYYVKNEKTPKHSEEKELPDIEAGGDIKFIVQPLDDLWTRDTGPVFVFDQNEIPHGINFNFNGWGQSDTGAYGWKKSAEKAANGIIDQRIKEDKKIADFIIQRTEVRKLRTFLVMEGGGLEVNGKGTAICTESCILNDNRNPGINKEDVETELLRLVGVEKVIWLPGLKGMDITDGHVDFYARFVGESTVAVSLENDERSPDYEVTRQNLRILSNATDALGNQINTISLVRPNIMKVKAAVDERNEWYEHSYFNIDVFADGYIGFYLTNECVIMAMFGDEGADEKAFDTLCSAFPYKTIIQITTDGIANGGGTIHCSTQQEI